MKTAIASIILALTLSACGVAPDDAGDVAPSRSSSADAPSRSSADTAAAPSLVGTWIHFCDDTTTTLYFTASAITIVTHIDGYADQSIAGAYTTPAGHIILNQDGAQLDVGAYVVNGDTLAIAGAFSGSYQRATE